MSSMNESISIINHFCYKCLKEVDVLTTEHKCGHCGTGFVEEILGTPLKMSNDTIVLNSDKEDISAVCKSPEKVDCSICLQEMDANTEVITILVCKHSFHKQCVKNWFQQSNNCPLCRGKVDVPSVITPARNLGAPSIRTRVIIRHRSRSPIGPHDFADMIREMRRPASPASRVVTAAHVASFSNVSTPIGQRRVLSGGNNFLFSPVDPQSGLRSPEFEWMFTPNEFGQSISFSQSTPRTPSPD